MAINTLLPHPRLSLVSPRKTTRSHRDLHCKPCLELVFLRSKIRERWGSVKVLATKNTTSDSEIWSDFSRLLLQNISGTCFFIFSMFLFVFRYIANIPLSRCGSQLRCVCVAEVHTHFYADEMHTFRPSQFKRESPTLQTTFLIFRFAKKYPDFYVFKKFPDFNNYWSKATWN